MDQSLGKNEKLKSKTLIDTLFSEGKAIKKFPLKLVYTPISNPSITTNKVGVSVPKKLFKFAVHRNRVKRLMREAFRKNKYLVDSSLQTKFAFMFIYLSRDEISAEKLSVHMVQLLEKFKEKENSNEKSTE